MIQNQDALARTPVHEYALDATARGIEAARPQRVIETAVSFDGETLTIGDTTYALDSFERVLVVGGGKPAGAIAQSLEPVLGDVIDEGVVVTDTPRDTEMVTVHEGTHPIPSAENVQGTEQVLELAETATADDLVLAVVGGGASALLCAPVERVSLEAYRDVTDALLRSGASIDDINAVRKHLSTCKGGRLAGTIGPATTAGVVVSDVVGSPLDVIGSGPTASDSSTYADALDVLERHDIDAPESVMAVLTAGADGERPETPDETAPVFERVDNHILADNRTAIESAADACEAAGYETAILSARIEGEASDVGAVHAAIGLSCLDTGEPFEPPVALLSGGETTVTVTGEGDGGPNQETALAGALELEGRAGRETAIVFASVDTDGIDGPTDAAGAIVDPTTVPGERGEAERALDSNSAYDYLDGRDCLVRTRRTGTNVNDLRVLLVGSPDAE
jgi:glycerate 2-kinase